MTGFDTEHARGITVWACDECGYWRQEHTTGVHTATNPADPAGPLLRHVLREVSFVGADALDAAVRRAEQAEQGIVEIANKPGGVIRRYGWVDPSEAKELRERVAALQAQLEAYEEAVALIDSPYPIGVFPDLQDKEAVFAAMREVNVYATEQFFAETARQRGRVVRDVLAGRGVREPEQGE